MKIEMKAYLADSSISCDVMKRVESMCDSVGFDYPGDMFLCDAISEAADSNVPIYNDELLSSYQDVEMHIKDALHYGIPEDFSIPRIIGMGYQLFLEEVAYENISSIMFDRMAATANMDPRLTGDDVDPETTERVIATIESLCKDIDPNLTFDAIDALYVETMAPFKQKG